MMAMIRVRSESAIPRRPKRSPPWMGASDPEMIPIT
jgi:hypothetical protein